MKQTDDIAISVKNVSKTFKLPNERISSVKSMFVNPFRRRTFERQKVLDNVSFDIKKGEFFGIVGRNGSGKSTLLKMLAGIYAPDKGSISIHGKLVPFIELGVGFNQELSGRENVFLNGALLGFARKQMEAMYDEIVEFAELGGHMDVKLKNYSSGMQVRLAFSIAIRTNSDILLIDEVLAVGDANFQQKCFNFFRQLKEEGKTVVFVSHDMNSVRKFCTRAVIISEGEVKHIGTASEISDQYSLSNIEIANIKNASTESSVIRALIVKDKDMKERKIFRTGETVNLLIELKPRQNYTELNFSIGIRSADDVLVFGCTTQAEKFKVHKKTTHQIILQLTSLNLLQGTYYINVTCYKEAQEERIDLLPRAAAIIVQGNGDKYINSGLVNLANKWREG